MEASLKQGSAGNLSTSPSPYSSTLLSAMLHQDQISANYTDLTSSTFYPWTPATPRVQAAPPSPTTKKQLSISSSTSVLIEKSPLLGYTSPSKRLSLFFENLTSLQNLVLDELHFRMAWLPDQVMLSESGSPISASTSSLHWVPSMSLRAKYEFNGGSVMDCLKTLPELRQLGLTSLRRYSREEILDLLNGCKKLQRLVISVESVCCQAISTSLDGSDVTISSGSSHVITFEKGGCPIDWEIERKGILSSCENRRVGVIFANDSEIVRRIILSA
jgi:hypothetical protein